MKKTLLLLLLPLFTVGQAPVFGPSPSASPVVTYANADATSVEFFWTAVEGAKGYVIDYQIDSGATVKAKVSRDQTRYLVSGLANAGHVNFTVTPEDHRGQLMASGTTRYRLGGECASSVVPPAIPNGVSVTATGTGSVETYLTSYSSCGIATTPPNSLWLGQTGSFSYTMTFSVPVNNLVIAITATGNTADEIFIFNTNGGVPIIQTSASCFTVVTGNQIASGNNSGFNGGGGIFTIQAPANFTSLTISGPGGTAGSLLSLCSNSVAPVECNVGFAPTLTASNLSAVCPVTTVNLNSISATNQPGAAGVSLTWHSAIPVSQANLVTGNPGSQPAGPTYYAAFYDGVNDCFSTPTTVTTTITATTPLFTQVAPICAGENIAPLPLVSNDGIAGSWAPALNTNATTTYTFTPNASSCTTTASMTIVVTPVTNPSFDVVAPICAGDPAPELMAESINGITGSWSPAINNAQTTTYTFTPDAGQCATPATLIVVVNQRPVVTIEQNCVGQDYVLTALADITPDSYEWLDDTGFQIGAGPTLIVVTPGTYHLVVANNDFCTTPASAVVETVFCEIQKGISPNGDTLNDFFDLSNLDVANLKIFNRYGMIVYDRANYTNQWYGKTNSGDELPDSVYYYLIQLNDGQSKTGWVYVNTKS